jgi:hypothetical protein
MAFVRFKLLAIFVVAGSLLMLSDSLLAHHGNAALDVGKKVTVTGAVTQWLWANPHCWLKVDVKDANGNVVNWVGETNNAADMMEKGWSKQTFKVGDEVSVTLEPVKNGKPAGKVLEVVLPNGQTLTMAYLKR